MVVLLLNIKGYYFYIHITTMLQPSCSFFISCVMYVPCINPSNEFPSKRLIVAIIRAPNLLKAFKLHTSFAFLWEKACQSQTKDSQISFVHLKYTAKYWIISHVYFSHHRNKQKAPNCNSMLKNMNYDRKEYWCFINYNMRWFRDLCQPNMIFRCFQPMTQNESVHEGLYV